VQPFVQPRSIVQRVWGNPDLVLLISAAAAAEFALNRAVDWLFVTGRVVRDPWTRLLDTAAYAQRIAFGDDAETHRALAEIRAVHEAVERRRGTAIPAWSKRDVLYLLVDYSERSFRLLRRPLVAGERRELWDSYRRVGTELGIEGLPETYTQFRLDRELHLERDLALSRHTLMLYSMYRRHLGPWRYALLRQLQAAVVRERVRRLLGLPARTWARRVLGLYPLFEEFGLRRGIERALIPRRHRSAMLALDRAAA
jgi:mpaB/rubber oxygenase-like protein